MDSHFLFELTDVLYRICSAIIHGKCRLMETPGKLCLLYPSCKRWFRNLAQDFPHNIGSYSPAGWTPTLPFVKMLFLTGKRLAGWCSWPLFVDSIFFVIRSTIRAGRGLFPLCPTKLPLQIINLSLHGLFITLFVNCVTLPPKIASTCVDRLQTAFLIVIWILFMLKVEEFILLVNVGGFCMLRTGFV